MSSYCNHFERDTRINLRICNDCYESKKSRDCKCNDCYEAKKIHNCNCSVCYKNKKSRDCNCNDCYKNRKKYSYEKKCKKNERLSYCCDNYYEKCNKMIHNNEDTENKDDIKSENENIIIINPPLKI